MPGRPGGRRVGGVATAVAIAGAAIRGSHPSAERALAAARDDVTVLVGEATTLDPAAQGDATSASITAQLFESVTAIDPSLEVRPALAASWDVEDGGRRIVFRLRDGLRFSDGSPLDAEHVVASWMRLIDPARPSPLASLMLDVEGAAAWLRGEADDPASVGLRASGRDVEVRLVRPAAEFPAVVAGPSFGVVHPAAVAAAAAGGDAAFAPPDLVSSGAYRLVRQTSAGLMLDANEHYWAGAPAIATVRLLSNLGGENPVAAFEAGDVDYTGISSLDAAWIAYDPTLGPSLRDVPSIAVEYYGFDTTKPPFDDPRVRQAFASAVDWRRIVALATPDEAIPATSMVPPGIPDRSERDFLPAHDPDRARALLADAGYPGGSGFPDVTLLTAGSAYDEALRAQLRDVLGVEIGYETMDFTPYFERLTDDPPAIWSISWVADYPGQNDFLGVLLRDGQSNNYGAWRSAEFEAAITDAGSATDAIAAGAAFERAQEVVQRDAPVVPVAYGRGWALARDGLLGATQNGLSILRLAGLAWSE